MKHTTLGQQHPRRATCARTAFWMLPSAVVHRQSTPDMAFCRRTQSLLSAVLLRELSLLGPQHQPFATWASRGTCILLLLMSLDICGEKKKRSPTSVLVPTVSHSVCFTPKYCHSYALDHSCPVQSVCAPALLAPSWRYFLPVYCSTWVSGKMYQYARVNCSLLAIRFSEVHLSQPCFCCRIFVLTFLPIHL